MSRPGLIVDGYNVVHSAPRYSALAQLDIDAARTRLVGDVAAFALDRFRATIVFDGAGNRLSDGAPHRIGDVIVIFSAAGTSADDVVEALAFRARVGGTGATVVTSDTATQRAVSAAGVSLMSAHRFADEIDATYADRDPPDTARPRSSTIERRVDPATRAALARWARGTSPGGDAQT